MKMSVYGSIDIFRNDMERSREQMCNHSDYPTISASGMHAFEKLSHKGVKRRSSSPKSRFFVDLCH